MNLFTALKFDGKHICKSPATEVAHFDLLSSKPSLDNFTGELAININIIRDETQARPGKPPPANGATPEHKGVTETVNVNNGTSSEPITHYVVVLDLNDSTKQAKVSRHSFSK